MFIVRLGIEINIVLKSTKANKYIISRIPSRLNILEVAEEVETRPAVGVAILFEIALLEGLEVYLPVLTRVNKEGNCPCLCDSI